MKITGIKLSRVGRDAVVYYELNNQIWVEVIREPYDGCFDHIVNEPGLREAKSRNNGNWPFVQKLVCASCGEESSNPGQFVADGRWVCTEDCRNELALSGSYDDLRASGGIVGAP